MEQQICARCKDGFETDTKIMHSTGQLWHEKCFVCAQCFQPFKDGLYYEFDGRQYCEYDFQILFSPKCYKCGEFIVGRVIKTLNISSHPECFRCTVCNNQVSDTGFKRDPSGSILCQSCNVKAKVKVTDEANHLFCYKCKALLSDDVVPIEFQGDFYHPEHFECSQCRTKLDETVARVLNNSCESNTNNIKQLYCRQCFEKLEIPICGACHRPVEQRVVTALNKHWHSNHFACAKCEKPFFGNSYYEKSGVPYCKRDYFQLFGHTCFTCNKVITNDVVLALHKAWCPQHFSCSICDQRFSNNIANGNAKFCVYDLKPICKKCYEKMPKELRDRLKRQYHSSTITKQTSFN